MPAIIAFTSAKSRLMMPGMVMMSEMPCTPCRRISSAMRNDSKKPAFSATPSNFSFGITMVVSTDSMSSAIPRSACCMRRLPSNAKGLVTTATVSAPISLASEAMIGAAPVPVPPPSPAVTNTMSAPSRASIILSESSSAPLRPISGLAPAPSPLVSFTPSCILMAARDIRKACKSVLATMNSMCSIPESIMRLTALLPPPPTPMTLIRASLRASSLKQMRSPLSSIIHLVNSVVSCWRSAGRPRPAPAVLGALPREQRLHTRPKSRRLQPAREPRPMPVIRHAQHRRKFRLSQKRWHLRHRHWPSETRGFPQDGFRHVKNAGKARSPSAQHESSDAVLQNAGVAQVIAQQLEKLAGTRPKNFARHALRHHARWPVSDRRHLDFIALGNQRRHRVAKVLLKRLRIRQPRTHADREIAGKVVAADRNHGRVRDRTLLKNDQIARTSPQIDEADAQFTLVGPQHRVRASQRLKNGVVHVHARPVHRSHQVLRGARRSGHNVYPHFEARRHHARGILHPGLIVENELLWQQMQNLAIPRQRHGASFVHRLANFLAPNLPRPGAESNSAVAVHPTNMCPRNPDQRMLDRNAG